MVEIRKLKPIERLQISDIFNEVFDSDMPPPPHSEFYGLFEDGRLEGFILAEQITIIGQIFIKNEKNNSNYARKLIRFVRDKAFPTQSVAALASETRFEMLYRTLGLQKIKGTLFRRG